MNSYSSGLTNVSEGEVWAYGWELIIGLSLNCYLNSLCSTLKWLVIFIQFVSELGCSRHDTRYRCNDWSHFPTLTAKRAEPKCKKYSGIVQPRHDGHHYSQHILYNLFSSPTICIGYSKDWRLKYVYTWRQELVDVTASLVLDLSVMSGLYTRAVVNCSELWRLEWLERSL